MDEIVNNNEPIKEPGALKGIKIFNESPDIYEVEKIIAGPCRRREHLMKMCYKVRWKGYGPEEDTWQPKADLVYVQDLIEEFLAERRAQKKRKAIEDPGLSEKEGPAAKKAAPSTASEPKKEPVPEPEAEQTEADWHPDYGYMKDTFWKDLELGRIKNIDIFEGDMYSKVKGSRRAAHAEAMANIQKKEPKESKSNSPPVRQKTTPPKLNGKNHIRRGSPKSLANSPVKRVSPKASKNLKRKSEPFSAKGYSSNRRNRRSKGVKISSPSDLKISSTETLPVLPCPAANEMLSADNTPCKPDANLGDLGREDMDEVLNQLAETAAASSASGLTLSELDVDAHLDEDIIKPEAIFNLEADHIFQPPLSDEQDDDEDTETEDSPDVTDVFKGVPVENSSNPSFTSIPDSTSDSKKDFQRSTFEGKAEARLTAVRSHDEECLWGGACNRSDCKANRRWNNKNGRETDDGNKGTWSADKNHSSSSSQTSSSSSSTATASSSSSSLSIEVPRMQRDRGDSSSSSQRHNSTASSSHPLVFSPSPIKSSPAHSSISPSYPAEHSHGPLSSRSYSSDSSFDEGVVPGLSKDAVSNTFSRSDAALAAQRSRSDASRTSLFQTLSSKSSAASERDSSMLAGGSRYSGGSAGERPGLFSDSFSFFLTEPSSVRDSPAVSTGGSTGASQQSSVSSPGKENTGSIALTQTSSVSSVHISRDDRPAEVASVDAVSSSSSSQLSSTVGKSQRAQESQSARKRPGDLSQPLEKIPSPNSRKDSDLDKRISTLTCDELEDFPDQGDDYYGSRKDNSYVTNADLFQAVSLSKAEVVKRGVQQMAGSKLDLEQVDTTGLSLLMKAVQKGNLAIVEMLLENGANVNAQQPNGVTALMIAAEQNNVCLVTLLLKHGANSSLYTVNSDVAETALMKAIKRQHKEVVNLMLRVGVNISAPSCNSMSALQMAIDRRNPHLEALVRAHVDRLKNAFEGRVLSTLEDTAQLMDQLFPLQCFPLRESQQFVVKFNSNIQPVPAGEGFLLFIAHTKINDKGVRCRFHGSCPIASVYLNGIEQSPLTKEVNFVTSCHPIISGCNKLVISKLPDYTSKAKLLVCAYRAKLICS